MTLRQEDTGEIKYEVRSTKYEVEELGATELRRGVGRRQSRNDARRINQGTREVEAPLACRASVTRMRISMGAFFENFIGTGVITHFSKILLGQMCTGVLVGGILFRDRHDIEAEDSGKEVGFGSQSHIFNGEVMDAADHQLESSVIETHAEARDTL